MIQLFIDRGNTALKWQALKSGELLNQGIVSNDVSLDAAFAVIAKQQLLAIYVSSVASSEFSDELACWAKRHGQPAPVFVDSCREACGIINAYKEPSQLGVDRWLAMIAARHQYDGLLCVVDSGTALTMDFVSGEGAHLGGFIVPGSALMKGSLLSNTQKIEVGDVFTDGRLGVNTSEAVVMGVEQMLQSFVHAKVLEIEACYQQNVTLVITGGHGQVLADNLALRAYLEKDLVLQGLRFLSEQNE